MQNPDTSGASRDSASGQSVFVLGNGGKKPHSATRFVLPFRLKPCSDEKRGRPSSSAGKAKVCYRKAEDVPGSWILANMKARERYLINETRTVLFNRATWWILNHGSAPIVVETLDKKKVTGAILPPAVILFEDGRGFVWTRVLPLDEKLANLAPFSRGVNRRQRECCQRRPNCQGIGLSLHARSGKSRSSYGA